MADEGGKKHCGSFVVMKSGKRYLFSVENSEVKLDDAGQVVLGYEGGKIVFLAPVANVECWGGDTWFFKDAWWGKQ